MINPGEQLRILSDKGNIIYLRLSLSKNLAEKIVYTSTKRGGHRCKCNLVHGIESILRHISRVTDGCFHAAFDQHRGFLRDQSAITRVLIFSG